MYVLTPITGVDTDHMKIKIGKYNKKIGGKSGNKQQNRGKFEYSHSQY